MGKSSEGNLAEADHTGLLSAHSKMVTSTKESSVQAWCRDTVTKHQKQESLDSALQKEFAEFSIKAQMPPGLDPQP